jgi:hypothetical protein
VVLARAAYHTGPGEVAADPPAGIGLAPHPNSTIRGAFHAAWPAKQAGASPQPADDFLQIDYVRIEDRARPSRMVSYYRRQLRHGVEHALPEGTWLDDFSEAAETGQARSIDVLVTPASAKAAGGADDEQELTVQILAVQVPRLREP